MALQRNGNGNGNLKRNPKTNGEDKGLMYKGKLRNITRYDLDCLIKEDRRVVTWLKELSEIQKFSREFILTCLTELGLQCMGKFPSSIADMHINRFLPKTAISAFKLMAEMQGYNVFKIDARLGVLTAYNGPEQKQIDGDIGPKMIELKNTDDTTARVAQILSKVGAFESTIENVTDAKVVEVHPA